jgi:hypothetical protein
VQLWGDRKVHPLFASNVTKSKCFWGRIVTVSDQAGRTVAVSKYGVDELMIKLPGSLKEIIRSKKSRCWKFKEH